MPGEQSRRFCFTLNNFTTEENDYIDSLVYDKDLYSYLVYSREIGESGTPHLQGYIELEKRKTLNGLKKELGEELSRLHLEISKGTLAQNLKYIGKNDNKVLYRGRFPLAN